MDTDSLKTATISASSLLLSSTSSSSPSPSSSFQFTVAASVMDSTDSTSTAIMSEPYGNLSSFEEFCGNSPFWDIDLLLNSPYPKFTECFMQVGLAWVPCLLYIVAWIPYIFWVRSQSPVPVATKLIGVLKTICTICLLGITIATIIVRATDDDQESIPDALYVSEGLKAFCFLVSLYTSHVERRRGVVASPVNWTFWLLLLIASVVPFYTYLEEDVLHTDRFGFIMFFVYFALVFISFIIASFIEPKTQEYMDLSLSNSKYPSPETTASIPSRVSFWWITRLVVLGFKKSLKEEDVFDLEPSDKCETLMPSFLSSWQKETLKAQSYNSKVVLSKADLRAEEERKKKKIGEEKKGGLDKPAKSPYKSVSVFRTLAADHGLLLLSSLIIKALFDLLTFTSPLITEALLDYIEHRDELYEWRGYILALSYLIVNLIVSVGSNQGIYYTKRIGMRMRASLVNAIYRKSLTAVNIGDETSRGEVVNLMSVDAERVQSLSNYIFFSVSAPLQVILAFYLLYRQLGVAMFAGMAVMLLMFPINFVVGSFFSKWQNSQMKLKDKRINLLSEILNGIKVLKLYAWEGSFEDKIESIRRLELQTMTKLYNLDAVIMFTFMALPTLVQLTSYGVRVAEEGYLDPTVAFVSLQLFNMLNAPLTFLPLLIPFTIQTLVSVARINVYLNKPDINPDAIEIDVNADNDVKIVDGNFSWTTERPVPTLQNINLEVKPSSLVAVVGTVGSGKSSLLSAMLGEMEKLRGKVTVKGEMAYVPQQAWIQNGTVQDNIIFGKNYRSKKYERIIDACALRSDLEILPGGDKTEIGEKGINISGGQKQRVSLARAVYSDRDIYLLDDPLSAVDSHVGKHIFTHVVGKQGLLKHKTRILVTHGIQWLPMVDKIFVVSNGVISEAGTYEELLERNGDFAQLLKEYAQDSKSDSSEGEKDDGGFIDEMPFQAQAEPTMDLHSSWRETSFSDRSYELERTSLRQRKFSKSKEHQRDSPARRPSAVRRMSSRWDESLGMASHDTPKEDYKTGTKLIDDETGAVGNVKFKVYLYYLMEIGTGSSTLIALLYLLYSGTTIFSGIWLTMWTGDTFLLNTSLKDLPEYQSKTDMYLGIYGGASVLQGFFVFIIGFILAYRVVNAAKYMHKNMLSNVLKAPMSFFDTTPMGRIQNRFSRDVEVVDNMLPHILRQTVSSLFRVLVAIINITYATPIFLAALVPLAVIYFVVQVLYIPTIRQLRRINSVTRSPIFVHFSETLGGTASIRAYRCQDRFIGESMDKIDHNVKFYFASIAAGSWLSFCLQFLGILVVFAAAIFAVTATSIDPSVVGLSVSYATTMTVSLQNLVTIMSELETNVVSVERLKEYTVSPQEAPWVLEEHRPKSSWPETGTIKFDNYQTRYRPGLDLVLRDVTCTIKGGEKVGIVGRTGAGKSSMTVALFRIIEAAAGRIVIDGEDLSHMGLHDLRNKITILPQDPVIFSGTLRMNLDPFDKYREPELWTALEHSYLKEFVEQIPQGLDYECGEEGANLSVGQRQLLCLARTLLRKTKILVLDEATAAVDMETDDLIQQTIRTQFSDCTIFTIAHRLNTILDYDRVMVLDKGTIKEFDSPQTLLADGNSIFHGMAKDAGIV